MRWRAIVDADAYGNTPGFYHYDIRLHQEGDERIVTYVIIIYVYDIRRNV